MDAHPFFCEACRKARAQDRRFVLRRLCGPLNFMCRGCRAAKISEVAYMPQAETLVVCSACKKLVSGKKCWSCPWCFGFFACTHKCWESVGAAHLATCEFAGSNARELLGFSVGDGLETVAAECCCDEDSVGARSHSGGNGSGRSRYTSAHWHRHPFTQSKALYILREGKLHNHALTGRQQRWLGHMASSKRW